MIFGRHDLVQDAPISRLDLLICRNTLMYFNSDLQARILRNFHFALAPHGFLFLGKAETMLTHASLFEPQDLRQRLFVKRPVADDRQGHLVPRDDLPVARHLVIRDAAIDSGPVAQLVIDVDGELVVANQQARALFNIGTSDLGRTIQDLEVSYRPLELRSRIDAAYADRRPVHVPNVDRAQGNGDVQSFDVTIAPIFDTEGNPLGVTVSFTDVTRYRRLRVELERSNQELETAYEELQSTNEELETTNEELQSTVEELETTNEELQSSNEELETTNEELQSTNSEIQNMNDEMRDRTESTSRAMALSEAVLSSLEMGVIVLGRDLAVQSWNEHAEDLFGLRRDEVEGQVFMGLDIGLPVGELEDAIRSCLDGERARKTVEATNRRGRTISCRVSCNPLQAPDGTLQGVVVFLERLDVED